MTTETTPWPDEPTVWTAATWRSRRPATSFAVDPYCYPGTRPQGSYAVDDGLVWGLDAVDEGWVDRDTGDRIDLGAEHWWWLTEMDRWEGAPHWYERRLFDGPVLLESGAEPDGVWVYVGTEDRRPTLRVGGRSLRVAEHSQGDVERLVAR